MRRFTFLFWHRRVGRRWVHVDEWPGATAHLIAQVAWTNLLNDVFSTEPIGPMIGWICQAGWEK